LEGEAISELEMKSDIRKGDLFTKGEPRRWWPRTVVGFSDIRPITGLRLTKKGNRGETTTGVSGSH